MPARRQPQTQRQTQQQPQGPVWQPVHRLTFVQRLMRTGFMTKATALDIFEELTGSDSEAEFQDMIAAQNTEVRELSFEIKQLKHPGDKQLYIAFVNTLADEPSKFATVFNHGQREFFKHVLAAIAADPTAEAGVGVASSIALLNMDLSHPIAGQEASEAQQQAATQAKKLSKADKSKFLDQMVSEGWLQHSRTRSGYFCIGPRSFMELSDLLLSLEVPDATRAAWEDFL